MSRIPETIATVVITFFLTLFLRSLIDYVRVDRATVTMGPEMIANGETRLPIDITNYSDEPLQSLRFSVPVSVVLTATVSSNPVTVQDVSNVSTSSGQRLIDVADVPPNQVTRIWLLNQGVGNAGSLRLLNAEEHDIATERIAELTFPLLSTIANATYTALLTALIVGAAVYVTEYQAERRKKELDQEISNLKNDVAKAKQGATRLRSLVQDYQAQIENAVHTFRRLTKFSAARLSDYRMELEFWRNTVRKMLYTATKEKVTAEKLFEMVTETLETYHVREKSDFEENVEEFLATLRAKFVGDQLEGIIIEDIEDIEPSIEPPSTAPEAKNTDEDI